MSKGGKVENSWGYDFMFGVFNTIKLTFQLLLEKIMVHLTNQELTKSPL